MTDANNRFPSAFLLYQDVPADPYCDEHHPKRITFEDVSAASFRIASGIRKTPCSQSHLSKIFNMELYFKKEQMQVSLGKNCRELW